jgi:hypothetical protein
LVTPGAYPRRKHLKGAPIGLALALPSISKTRLERVSKDEPSSLLGPVVSEEGKKFYNIDTSRNFKRKKYVLLSPLKLSDELILKVDE